jgi:hypothetical protein
MFELNGTLGTALSRIDQGISDRMNEKCHA